ncbi:hypothetical protein VPH35_065995 [Triticum aestivum]
MIAATSDDHTGGKGAVLLSEIMDPAEDLNVRFHYGGEFIRIGPSLDYVDGDNAMSVVERDKLLLPELKGFLADHLTVKENVGVANIFVEYNGEQDEPEEDASGSDFEDELHDLMDNEDEPDAVITPEEKDILQSNVQTVGAVPEQDILEHILVPNEGGVVTEIISSLVKHNIRVDALSQGSQLINPSPPIAASQNTTPIPQAAGNCSESEDSDDPEYVAHTDDSGEESEVVELRKHARKFKKKMKASETWFAKESTDPVPIELVANVEEAVHDMEFESSDEDYSYDEDEDGQFVRRKSQFVRFNTESEIPHFSLGTVFKSKNQLVKALKRYGLQPKGAYLS